MERLVQKSKLFFCKSLRGAVAKVLDCEIIVSDFKLQLLRSFLD